MREILFRGKRVDNGALETGSLVILWQGTSREQVYIADKVTGYHTPVDPSTVGQYTGLTDKNGLTKIFEGDVIKIPWNDGYQNRVVIFENGLFEARSKPDSYGGFFSAPIVSYAGFINPELHCEVIGNIHDNPELLEVSK